MQLGDLYGSLLPVAHVECNMHIIEMNTYNFGLQVVCNKNVFSLCIKV